MFSERGMNLSELAGVGGSCISWNHAFSICSQRAGWVPCSGCEAGFWGTWPPWPRLCRDVVEQGEPWCWTARRPQGGVLSGPWSWRGLTGTEGQGEPAVWRGLWGGTLSGALCNAGRVCALPVAPAHSGWGLRVEILAALLLNLSFQAPQLGTGSSYVFLGPL